MAKRIIVTSDIHMGIDSETNWWQSTVHKKALKSILRYAESHAEEVEDFVILGDWFDQWTYTPEGTPPSVSEIMDNNRDLFTPAADGSGDFVSVMRRIEGKLRYVNGNHDMLLSLSDMNAWLEARGCTERIYPGVGDDLSTAPSENLFYETLDGLVHGEHGHLYDLFNKPFDKKTNPYPPLPVGHFVTRTVAKYVREQLSKSGKHNSAQLPGSGDPNYSRVGVDAEIMWKTIEALIEDHEKPRIAQILLHAAMAFAKCDKLEYNMSWYRGGHVSSEDIGDYYAGLISIEHLDHCWLELKASLTGLDDFAERYLKHHRDTKILIMGHTHQYKMVRFDGTHSPLYVNAGFGCAAEPDMLDDKGDDKGIITFIEVVRDGGLTVNEKIVDFETGVIRQGESQTMS